MLSTISENLEVVQEQFGPVHLLCSPSTLEEKLEADDPLFTENYQHGCLNIVFCQLLLQCSTETPAVWEVAKKLWALKGTARIYFNFHNLKSPAVSPDFIRQLFTQKKWKYLRLFAREQDHYRSIRPVFSSQEWKTLQRKTSFAESECATP